MCKLAHVIRYTVLPLVAVDSRRAALFTVTVVLSEQLSDIV